MGKAPDKSQLTIPGPAGELEALLELPQPFPADRIAVICHPHPQFQGTMHNKVVHTLARAMNDLGLASLRFNFRGVGASEGSYANGEGEIADVEAVAAYARQRWPGAEIWLAGFSFGAVVTVRAAASIQPARLVSIAPAVNILGTQLHQPPRMPWLIVQGDADEIVPVDAVESWVTNLKPRPQLIVLPGVGHFFHGYLVQLRELLIAELDR